MRCICWITAKKIPSPLGLSLRGQIVSRIELSLQEYDEVRCLSLEEAVQQMIKKDPLLKADHLLVFQIVNLLRNGNFHVNEVNSDHIVFNR